MNSSRPASPDATILRELFDVPGAYVSGEFMAQAAGMSRAAIKKRIDGLIQAGYPIEAQHHSGYRLTGAVPDIWCAEEIEARLPQVRKTIRSTTEPINWRTLIFRETKSTNDTCWREADADAAEGLVVCADQQTAGRGRLGRSWISEARAGLWCSILLRPAMHPKDMTRLTILTAVALAEALESVARENGSEITIGIKWPNDLLVEGRKVCGTLTEVRLEADALRLAIVGFGINVAQLADHFPDGLRTPPTSLRILTGLSFRRADVLLHALAHFEQRYRTDFEETRQAWTDRSITTGKEVTISDSTGHKLHGTAIGINDSGALQLRLPDGQETLVFAGDLG